jgi:hypothetical protein
MKKKIQVQGKDVEILDGIRAFIYRDPITKSWTIAEYSTGLELPYFMHYGTKTQKSLIERTRAKMEEIGIDQTLKAIAHNSREGFELSGVINK